MSDPVTEIQMRILVIDDEPAILHHLKNHLTNRGHHVLTAETGEAGLALLQDQSVDIVITDLKMPGINGFEVLQRVQEIAPTTDVILVTAYGDIDSAVRAMREGAFDFFTKPVKLRDLLASLQRTERFHALRRENVQYKDRLTRLESEVQTRYGLSALIGQSPGIQTVRNQIQQISQTDATTVLITGETGTGKELVARAIHTESVRANGPFIAVDCSSVPEALIESEFHGHERGAFTDARETHIGYFEQANGGTLFLDEIGDMNPFLQARLLRTLETRTVRHVGGVEERPINVRIISATNRNLPEAIAQNAFRKDLFYRLNAFAIQLPPLRKRPEDTPLLARHFLSQYAREMRKPITDFTIDAIQQLTAHDFPGNVRELRNAIERAVILCQTDKIGPEDLDLSAFRGLSAPTGTPSAQPAAEDENLNLEAAEQTLIQRALAKAKGNQVQAARLLGLSRTSLRRRLKRYGIPTR